MPGIHIHATCMHAGRCSTTCMLGVPIYTSRCWTRATSHLEGTVCVLLQVRDLLVPLVQPWVPLICGVLSSDPAARAGWPVKLGALRLGLSITSYFSKPLSAAMPHLMSATWQLLLALQVGRVQKTHVACTVCSCAVCAASSPAFRHCGVLHALIGLSAHTCVSIA